MWVKDLIAERLERERLESRESQDIFKEYVGQCGQRRSEW